MASDVKFEIIQHICVLSEKGTGWRKECNLVRWNDGAPKLDIRDWSQDRSSMSKGVTLNKKEFNQLISSIRYVKTSLWDKLLKEIDVTESSGGDENRNNVSIENTQKAQSEKTEKQDAAVSFDMAPAMDEIIPETINFVPDNQEAPETEKMASGM